MAATTTVNGVPMREISTGTAILLSIITLGIYWLILVYRNTVDIHRAADEEHTLPMVLFVVGIFFPLVMLGTFSLNGIRLNEVREEMGHDNDPTWIIALVLTIIPFVGSIVWGIHYDSTLRELGQAA